MTPPTVIENYEMTITWTDVSDPDHQYVVHALGQARDVPVRLVGGTVPGSSPPGPTSGARSSVLTSDGELVMHDRGRLQVTSLREHAR